VLWGSRQKVVSSFPQIAWPVFLRYSLVVYWWFGKMIIGKLIFLISKSFNWVGIFFSFGISMN